MKYTALRLVLLLMACLILGCQRSNQEKVVYLDKSRNFFLFSDDLGGARPLAREIVRQAFLLAARDELGLATRDAWLGDSMPIEGDNAPWDVIVVLRNPVIVKIVRGRPADQTELSSQELRESMRGYKNIDYRALTELEERLSRTGFVEGLKEVGYQGKANVLNEQVQVPEAIEKLLGEMNFLSQFRAVQELHRILHDNGESSALLGALSRGYANLGVLTEYYWHSAHKVFKARSLLYAQRMTVRDKKSPLAKWHRAYAAALTGIPKWAENDLEEANKSWQSLDEKHRPPRPAWVQLIKPLCCYQIAGMDQYVKDPEIGELAAMLRFLAVEQAGGQIWAVQTALQTLDKIPECYRINDTLCSFAGVRTLHSATIEPIEIVGETLYNRLEPMNELPGDVRAIIQKQKDSGGFLDALFGNKQSQLAGEFKTRGKLMQALLQADKRPAAAKENEHVDDVQAAPVLTEPSWATLGLLIRELSFMQVYRRANFERNCLDVPAEDWLAIAAPLVENHPYSVFLDTFAWENDKIKEASSQLANLDITGIEKNAYFLLRALGKENVSARMKFAKEMHRNVDYTVRDFVTLVRLFQQRQQAAIEYSKILLDISPNAPFARALLIKHDWEHVQNSADQWDKESSSYPYLSDILGERYMKLGRWDDAERCFKASIKAVPGDQNCYRQLANVYRLRGQTDRWLATLEAYLKQPDYSLAHFRVKSDIASHFMAKKDWKKALPYAEGAAESYSYWGLACAAGCHEGLQNWDKADQYYRAACERYRNSSLHWYFFCCRTGEGDREAAEHLAREYVKNLANIPGEPDLYDMTTFYLLQEQPEKALQTLEKALAKNPNPYDSLWSAMIADQLKDVAHRDMAFNRVKSLGTTASSGTMRKPDWANGLLDLISEDLAQGGKGGVDLDAADKIAAPLDGYRRAWFHYLLGQYLRLHGNRDAAHRYWKLCMRWTGMRNDQRTLAGAALLKDGIKPADYKEFLQRDVARDEKPTS